MIEQIKKLLGIGKYSKSSQVIRKSELKTLLLALKQRMLGHWHSDWMCTTNEGIQLTAYLKSEGLHLNTLNTQFGIQNYALDYCRLFPVQQVLLSKYNIETPMGVHHEKDSDEGMKTAEVRKELFDFWCMELIGEKL